MDNPSIAYRIFHDLYLVEIPEIYNHDWKHVKEVGTYTTGDREMDMQMAHAPLRRYMTIAAMVLFHDEGAPITLVNPMDSMQIYSQLMEHIGNWRWIIEMFLNATTPPPEDFYLMEAFANAIQPLAKSCSEGKPITHGVERALNTIRGKHAGLMSFRRVLSPAADVESPPAVQHEAQSLADEIARRVWS